MMSGTEASRRTGRRSHRDWSHDERESPVPFNEDIQVPSWDNEVFSGRGRAEPVDPVWETWMSSETQTEDQEGEKTASSASSVSTCRHCTKHSGDSGSTPPSGYRPFSAGGRHKNPAVGPSYLRLLGLTALAVLLVVAVVATNAKINRIVLGSLDTESPDATRQAKLASHKPSATETALPATLLPRLARDDVETSGEPGGDGTELTAVAGDLKKSRRGAEGTAEEDTGVTRRSRTLQTSTSDSGDGGDAGKTEEEASGRLQSNTTKSNCQGVVYTYCPVARREFHYRASVNACLATALDPMVQLCARGFNRFTSRATCEHSCVFGYRPKDACFDTPLFSGCEREDVSESWWYFESGRCRPWSFPAGACPSNDSAVFSTADECAIQCAGRGLALCGQAPRPTACGRNQLRFPYFAHFSEPEGRMRCLRASAVLDAAHRCLAGDNRFASLADCAEACATKASGPGQSDRGT
ncbi:uncharacterized protein LOC119405260 [Rhipicephalus sanguineus]|uniref:uncharacterized protein LOC119405260 n=1 Tax=Rhipicephalus sanguineus TaxID=34632 RepID=UPI0020C2D3DE|nr:uncharacterized protein LOC119405260 [Rhipicephalus sanguineus]